MIVKCPQCGTGYSIPENVIGDKPKKMRCSRCKNIFTLARRQEHAPSGYEEFTGSQQLPDEFAFLKTAPPEPPPAPAPEPAPEPAPAPAEQTAPAAAPPAERVAPPEGQVEPAAPPAPPPAPPRPAPPPRAHEAWEEEVPLELSGYSIPTESPHRGAQAFGKFVFVLVALAILFFGFVLYRNDWSLSLSDLGRQISFAFSGEELEKISDEAKNLDVVITGRKALPADGGGTYLVISGDVYNRGFTPASRIVLRARLTPKGEGERIDARAPCGRIVDEATIKLTAKGAMAGHYRERGELYNCVVSVNGSTSFQIVFDDPPADWETAYSLDVAAVAAQTAE